MPSAVAVNALLLDAMPKRVSGPPGRSAQLLDAETLGDDHLAVFTTAIAAPWLPNI